MASKVADLLKQAKELERSDRAKLITELLETLEPTGSHVDDFEAAWSDELDARERAIDDGEVEVVDWDALRESFRE